MSSAPENQLKRLVREIHRRSLWQVLGIYLLGSWVALQVVDLLVDNFGLPEWFPAFALALLVIGLPVVMATAFVQEGGPDVGSDDTIADLEGILQGEDRPPTAPRSPAYRLFTWRNALLGGCAAFVLLVTVGVSWLTSGGGAFTSQLGLGSEQPAGTAVEAPIEQSVAVLPFENMSADPDNEYFSDGITEELLNALAQIPDLRVPGRTSSFAFKGQNITIRQIADTLHVAHVLEGSVRRAGDRVLITAQLVDARADRHLWSDTYERDLTDIFAIQREIAAAIAEELQLRLSTDEENALLAGRTRSTEAHDAYLRGRHLWNQRTGESLRAAIDEFRRATDLDPEYAEAWVGLADAYMQLPEYAGLDEPRPWTLRGLEAASHAVTLSPELGMAHATLGFGRFVLGEWEDARRHLEAAIRLSPGYATAHQWYGLVLYSTGSVAEGVIYSERALELDPVSPIISVNLGRALRRAGRIEEAVRRLRATTGFAPAWPTGWIDLAASLLVIGEYDEGMEAWLTAARLLDSDVSSWRTAFRGAIRYHQTGQSQTAPDMEGNLTARNVVAVHLGNPGRLVALFDEFIREGTPGYLAVTHAMTDDRVRADPRYQALLSEAGITW